MLALKSLRVKIVLLALIPIIFVMGAVTVIAYEAIVKTARDVVQRRDTELARIAAARLAENLNRYVRILQDLAASDGCRSLQPDKIGDVINAASSWLYLFDGGVTVYNPEGGTVWSSPYAAHELAETFPFPALFDQLRHTLRPAFSDVFNNAPAGKDVVMIGDDLEAIESSPFHLDLGNAVP